MREGQECSQTADSILNALKLANAKDVWEQIIKCTNESLQTLKQGSEQSPVDQPHPVPQPVIQIQPQASHQTAEQIANSICVVKFTTFARKGIEAKNKGLQRTELIE